MKQPGFLLLEMIVSIMIASFLLTAVLTIYNQISKNAVRINRTITLDTQLLTIQHRLSLDLQGICPLWFTAQDYEKIKNAKNKPKNTTTAKGDNQPKQEEETETISTNSNNIFSKFLYSQNNNNNFEFATFITTNPLQTYPANQRRVVGVVYQLVKDVAQPDLFELQRKEFTDFSHEFDKQTLLKDNFYTLVNNIVSCKFEYGYLSASPDQQKQAAHQEWNIAWVDYWSTAKSMKKGTNYVPDLPNIVRVTLQLKDVSNDQTSTHAICCQLLQNQESKFESFAMKRFNAEQNRMPPINVSAKG